MESEESPPDTRCNENTRTDENTRNPDDEVPPRAEIQIKLMIAGSAIFNPLCTPLLLYVGRWYRRKWRQGLRGDANYYLKLIVIIFIVGIILTMLFVAVIVVSVIHAKSNNERQTNVIYVTNVTSVPLGFQQHTGGITRNNITEVVENSLKLKDRKIPKISGLNIASHRDVTILYRNETFMRIYSAKKGVEDLHVPLDFLQKWSSKFKH